MPHGYHGYWTKDLTKVNPAYGTEDIRSGIRELQSTVGVLECRKMCERWSSCFMSGR